MTSATPELDPDLLRRAQNGDQVAFGTIMRTFYERTYRVVHAILRREADARDVCQEVWLTVWKQLPTFRGDARFTTWLHPIATRRALDHLRKQRRWFDRFLPIDNGAEDGALTVPEPAGDADTRAGADTEERRKLLHAVLDTLPPKQRAALALRELEGMSYEEIAAATDVPVGTVMSRLHHARRLLAERLGKTLHP